MKVGDIVALNRTLGYVPRRIFFLNPELDSHTSEIFTEDEVGIVTETKDAGQTFHLLLTSRGVTGWVPEYQVRKVR